MNECRFRPFGLASWLFSDILKKVLKMMDFSDNGPWWIFDDRGGVKSTQIDGVMKKGDGKGKLNSSRRRRGREEASFAPSPLILAISVYWQQ